MDQDVMAKAEAAEKLTQEVLALQDALKRAKDVLTEKEGAWMKEKSALEARLKEEVDSGEKAVLVHDCQIKKLYLEKERAVKEKEHTMREQVYEFSWEVHHTRQFVCDYAITQMRVLNSQLNTTGSSVEAEVFNGLIRLRQPSNGDNSLPPITLEWREKMNDAMGFKEGGALSGGGSVGGVARSGSAGH